MTLVLEAASPAEKIGDTPVKIRKKRAPKHDFKDGRGRVFAHRHTNGEGWVEDTASVADSVYVAKTAQVYHTAKITGRVRVLNRAHVCGLAELRDAAEIKNNAVVAGNAQVADTAKVKDNARVHGGHLCGSTIVSDNAVVTASRTGTLALIRSSTLRSNVTVYDNPVIIDSALENCCRVGGAARLLRAILDGYVAVGGDAKIINSTLTQRRVYYQGVYSKDENAIQQNCLRVIDQAVICDCAHIGALLVFKGHAKAIGCNINFSAEHSNENYNRIEVDGRAVFIDLTAREISWFMRYNVPPSQRPAMGSLPAAPINSPVNVRVLAPGRRIMSAGA